MSHEQVTNPETRDMPLRIAAPAPASTACAPDRLELSVVVPLYNEEDTVNLLYRQIRAAITTKFTSFEVLFIDDGSRDKTRSLLAKIVAGDPDVRSLCLRRNFGQTAAMHAGIAASRGMVVVTMDGDLQNDPRDIPALVQRIDAGYDIVSGWRKARQDVFWSRKLPSRIANWIIRCVTKVPIHDTGCALKAYRGDLIRRLPLYSDLHRFIPAMCTLASTRFAEVAVQHHPRRFGKSKYGLSRTWRVMLDVLVVKMLTSFGTRPLHWFGIWSLLLWGLSFGMSFYCCLIALGTPGSLVIPMSLAMLAAYLAAHLLLVGCFAELIIRAAPATRVTPLVRVSSVTKNGEQPCYTKNAK